MSYIGITQRQSKGSKKDRVPYPLCRTVCRDTREFGFLFLGQSQRVPPGGPSRYLRDLFVDLEEANMMI